MAEFLYTQPPKELKFYPCGESVFNARGAVVLMDKQKNKLPDLEFYRFEFFMKLDNRIIVKAGFFMDQLKNLEEYSIGSNVSWEEEREGVPKFLEEDYEHKGEIDVADHEHVLNFWDNQIAHNFDDMKTTDELKRNFDMIMDGEFVVRHYFATTWVVLTGNSPIKIDFSDFFRA